MTKSINFGDKFKNLRKSRGLTQQEVANLCGISQVQVTRYEKGINQPTERIMDKICDGLSLPRNYFEDSFEISDESLDKDYQKLKESLVDIEDKFVFSRLMKSLYLTTQTKLALKSNLDN